MIWENYSERIYGKCSKGICGNCWRVICENCLRVFFVKFLRLNCEFCSRVIDEFCLCLGRERGPGLRRCEPLGHPHFPRVPENKPLPLVGYQEAQFRGENVHRAPKLQRGQYDFCLSSYPAQNTVVAAWAKFYVNS